MIKRQIELILESNRELTVGKLVLSLPRGNRGLSKDWILKIAFLNTAQLV